MAAFLFLTILMSDLTTIKRALISVSDKTGLESFATRLVRAGIEVLSTGGTATFLRDQGMPVTDVAQVTGFPEMMGGRVKTLHPKIHGALLGLRDDPQHIAAMKEHSIEPIDLLIVNLYPFEATVAQDGVTLETAVENIDIGGPAMIRSAAKNWRDVAVVTDPRLYSEIIDEIESNSGGLSIETRQRLAALAFTRTASYDLAISSYLARQLSNDDLERLEPFNPLGGLVFIEPDDEEQGEAVAITNEDSGMAEFQIIELAKVTDLRYGENPHQGAALYRSDGGGITEAEQLHGKEMSFNNYVDAEAAWNLVNDFRECAVAIIKHTNPSGVGIGNSNQEAYSRALATDPVSAFGGIVAFNRKVDAAVAAAVNEVFTEVVIAPDFDDDALDVFRQKKNLRVLRARSSKSTGPEYKQISGGMLVQDRDMAEITAADLKQVTKVRPTDEQTTALLFAWTVCKHVKSNAIVLARPGQTIGVGAGQMNRVDSIRIAATRAARFEFSTQGSVLASDAFFPFRDNVDEAAALGVSAIIQPGGSVKDEESIAAANEHCIAMLFTGIRHFKH
jgi:phosphoribosylaminoimidazolecarboxamide formyltransferase / IMP cyclohydrolase